MQNNWNNTGAGSNPWNNNSGFAQNQPPTPLMHNVLPRPSFQQYSNQMAATASPFLQNKQNQPTSLLQQYQQPQSQSAGNRVQMQNKQSSNPYTQMQGNQMLRTQQQQQQQPPFMNSINPGILSQPTQQQQFQQQQMQPNFFQNLATQQQNYAQQLQQQNFAQIQPQQQNFMQQQAFNGQWQQWNQNQGGQQFMAPAPEGNNMNNMSTNMIRPPLNTILPVISPLITEAVNPPPPPPPPAQPPPLPLNAAVGTQQPPPPPPAATGNTGNFFNVNPPLPPTLEASKPERRDFGKIISTDPRLMDIIAGKKKKDENKIPGLDFDVAPSPRKSPELPDPDVELVDLVEEDGKKKEGEDAVVSTGPVRNSQRAEKIIDVAGNQSSTSATAKIVGFTNQIAPSTECKTISAASQNLIGSNPMLPTASTQNIDSQPQAAPQASSTTTTSHSVPTQPHHEKEDNDEAGGKITLKAFDNKFRDWEKQFNEWKASSSKHPDQSTYATYLAQWETWREQLIQQRRCIIETMNREREVEQLANANANQGAFNNAPINPGSEQGLIRNQASQFQQPQTQSNTFANSSLSQASQFQQPQSQPNTFGNSSSNSIANNLLQQGQAHIRAPNASMGVGQLQQQTPHVNQNSQSGINPIGKTRPTFTPPATKDNYETRDLSKLIQNPFAVTGGPLTPEQRQFIQHQGIAGKQQQQQAFSGRGVGQGPRPRQPFGGLRAALQQPLLENMSAGKNPFEANARSQQPVIPSLLNPDSLPRAEISPPVDRVSRQHRNFQAEFENDNTPFVKAGENLHQLDLSSGRGVNHNNFRPPQAQFQHRPDHQFQNRSQLAPRPIGPGPNSFHQRPRGPALGVNRFQAPTPTPVQDSIDRFSYADDQRRGSNFESFSEEVDSVSEEFQRRPAAPLSGIDDFQFFRRGRRTVDFETEQDTTPVTIDYGHGSEIDEPQPLFTRDRSRFPDLEDDSFRSRMTEATSAEDDDGGVVTFDYGHGTTKPVSVVVRPNEQDDEFENYHDRYNHNPPEGYESRQEHFPYPPYHPAMRGRGFRGRRPFRGRGMPPMMRGGFPRQPFRHPLPDYEEGYEEGFSHPQSPGPPGRGPRFFSSEDHPSSQPEADARPARPTFPIGDRPVRIAPPQSAETEEVTLRQAPPRDLEPISPEGSPINRSRDRVRSRSERSRDRSSSRGRGTERSITSHERNESPRRRERELSPYSRRKREPSPVRRDRRGRSRSRDRVYRDRENRSSPVDRRGPAGRHYSPPPASSQPILIEDILNLPGRKKRPGQIVIILRGLPGSGKTHVAKLIKDRETDLGESAPRILSLDDYFMTGETEKIVKDPVTGKETKERIAIYEYDPALETRYRDDLFKTFRKTIEAGYFRFIIVDCVNEKLRHYQEMTNFAKAKRFQVYVVETEGKADECAKKNVHNRTLEEIREIEKNWERTPSNLQKLDVRTLLQDEAIHNVEMEDVSDSEDAILEGKKDKDIEIIEIEDEDEPWATSKWETSEDKLNKLDGLARKRKNADSDDEDNGNTQSMEQWLQTHLPEDYSFRRETEPGKKRVRWADIEARREQERARDVGFVVGQTNWSQMTDPSFASSALTRTKYF